jgi:hypothetical protein
MDRSRAQLIRVSHAILQLHGRPPGTTICIKAQPTSLVCVCSALGAVTSVFLELPIRIGDDDRCQRRTVGKYSGREERAKVAEIVVKDDIQCCCEELVPWQVRNHKNDFACAVRIHRICSGKSLVRDASNQARRCFSVQISSAVEGEYPHRGPGADPDNGAVRGESPFSRDAGVGASELILSAHSRRHTQKCGTPHKDGSR